MLLLTWNLNKNPVALRLALAHLQHNLDGFIACFQELPLEASSTVLARDATRQLVGDSISCLGVTPAGASSKHGRVGIFCSPGFRPQASDVEHDLRQRMAIISVLDARARPFLLLGYHGESRQNAGTEAQRSRIGVAARREVDRRWTQDSLIVFGDFNANPFDGEVCGTGGLYAVRDRDEARQERASPLVGLGETQRPLYNPMWSLLPESSARPGGTCVYTPELMLRWRLYDQILVSPDLIDALQGLPQILTEIGGQGLLNANGNIDESISDHLPVQIRVML